MSTHVLPVVAPYAFKGILEFLSHRAIPGLERVHDGHFLRSIKAEDGGRVLVDVSWNPQREHLVVRHDGTSEAVPHILESVARVFATGFDPAAMIRALAPEPRLAEVRSGVRVPGTWSPFELTVRAIVGQQISLAGARTILGRIVAATSPTVSSSPEAPSPTFPSPAELARADLSEVGLTDSRARTIREVAGLFAEGTLTDVAGEPFARGLPRLAGVRGIGPWTLGYLRMRAVADPDAYPAGDLVLRKRLGPGLSNARSLDAVMQRWQPWRAYAAMAIWAAP